MKIVYWALIVGAFAFVGLGFLIGQVAILSLLGVLCALAASAVDPSGRGLARYWRSGDDA